MGRAWWPSAIRGIRGSPFGQEIGADLTGESPCIKKPSINHKSHKRLHLPKRRGHGATRRDVQHAGPVPVALGPNDHKGIAVERDGVGTRL
jgi:hypothetical protein